MIYHQLFREKDPFRNIYHRVKRNIITEYVVNINKTNMVEEMFLIIF